MIMSHGGDVVAFHFVASVTCLELFPIAHFLGLVVGTSQMAPRGCGNALCAEMLERRRFLCLAGEDLHRGVGDSFPWRSVTSLCCSHRCDLGPLSCRSINGLVYIEKLGLSKDVIKTLLAVALTPPRRVQHLLLNCRLRHLNSAEP